MTLFEYYKPLHELLAFGSKLLPEEPCGECKEKIDLEKTFEKQVCISQKSKGHRMKVVHDRAFYTRKYDIERNCILKETGETFMK